MTGKGKKTMEMLFSSILSLEQVCVKSFKNSSILYDLLETPTMFSAVISASLLRNTFCWPKSSIIF